MAAIAELAVTYQVANLAETILDLLRCHMPKAELPNARGVDKIASTVEVKKLGGRRRVNPFTGTFRYGTYPD